MTPLPRPSVSPLPSFAISRPGHSSPVPFSAALMAIWQWLTSRRRPVPLKRQIAEQRMVEALIEEIEAEDAVAAAAAHHKAQGFGKRSAAHERKQGRRRLADQRNITTYPVESEDSDG